MEVTALNHLVGIGTVILQMATALLLALYIARPAFFEAPAKLLGKHGLWLAFLFAGFITAMSLVYSEYFGMTPCGLCWLQRIFIFPQTVLFLIAAYIKDARAALYSIALSVLGGAVALYQHYLQMGGDSVLPCPASGEGDCAKRLIFEFGYITFPLVAFSAFAFLIVLMLYVRRAWK